MSRSAQQLRIDAEQIWRAGVDAVAPDRLIREHVAVDGTRLCVGNEELDLKAIGRIAIVGAGKAAGAMAIAFKEVLGPRLLAEKRVIGWVNVPADCVASTDRITIHAGRPAGINEPRPEGVAGTRQIIRLISKLGPDDLCLCVIAGGGSALLPAPVPGISLDAKIHLTRMLSAAGANIQQLNTVRRELSLVKGGGLARACRAGRLIGLIISDVLGDPLQLIASGPTVEHRPDPGTALAILEDLQLSADASLAPVIDFLRQRADVVGSDSRSAGDRFYDPLQSPPSPDPMSPTIVTNHIIANNATAVDAAGIAAERLGYSHAMTCATSPEGPAEQVGSHLVQMALRMRAEGGPDCLITGGEPTVKLIEESRRGKGGRNQQLALAALESLGDCRHIALLSGGTDGEDGPTDAAGAVVNEDVVTRARRSHLDAPDYLARNDAYTFFRAVDGLFKTGPTNTNVCDLRVVTVDR